MFGTRQESRYYCLQRGEGLGHVGDPAAGVATRIARRFGDVIMLVDSAKAPMLEGPTSLLRAVAASGYQKKLGLAFHAFRPRARAGQLAELRTAARPCALAGQPEVGESPRRGRCSGRTRDRARSGGTAIRPETLPVYDTAALILAIQAATTDFHARWDVILGSRRSPNIRTAHWAEVKDLVARLAESVTRFLDNPIRWRPRVPADVEAEHAIERVQRAVFDRLHEFVDARLLRVPRADWTRAFDYRGPGSTFDRRRVIQTIYNASAPIPGPVLDTRSEHFLREVRLLLHEAVAEGGGELVSDVLGQPGA